MFIASPSLLGGRVAGWKASNFPAAVGPEQGDSSATWVMSATGRKSVPGNTTTPWSSSSSFIFLLPASTGAEAPGSSNACQQQPSWSASSAHSTSSEQSIVQGRSNSSVMSLAVASVRQVKAIYLAKILVDKMTVTSKVNPWLLGI